MSIHWRIICWISNEDESVYLTEIIFSLAKITPRERGPDLFMMRLIVFNYRLLALSSTIIHQYTVINTLYTCAHGHMFYLYRNSACLSVCLFVSNKRQNGWTDRAQILSGTLHNPAGKIYECSELQKVVSKSFWLLWNLKKLHTTYF